MIPIIDVYSRMVRCPNLNPLALSSLLRNTAPPEQFQTDLTMCAQRAQYWPNHTSALYLKILIMQDLSRTDTV